MIRHLKAISTRIRDLWRQEWPQETICTCRFITQLPIENPIIIICTDNAKFVEYNEMLMNKANGRYDSPYRNNI